MPTPDQIATWRFEMISDLLDDSLDASSRARLIENKSRSSVLWPSGREDPLRRSTIYRWLDAYEKEGCSGLLPKKRKDRGLPRVDRSAQVEKAVQLLLERPDRSVTMLLALLETHFPDHGIARATLQRELERHPLFAVLRRMRKNTKKTRTRFQAAAPHDLWQLDAKGPFSVRLRSGEQIRVTVLSILDDFSRAILGVTIASREKLGPAVRLFRSAAARWGLPEKLYADRHAVYDSNAFRSGLAVFGIHRIRSRSRNAPARGKIERYHRVLIQWFIKELEHQVVVDLAHLDDLLQAVIELLYQKHYHRQLKQSPADALAERRSARTVQVDELRRAFWVEKSLKAHPKTGEINLPGGLFLVPSSHAGKRVRVRFDPAEVERVVMLGAADQEIDLKPAFADRGETPKTKSPERGTGALQRLVDVWRNRELPQAMPGFGLTEILDELTRALGRRVPTGEREARAVQEFYRGKGPFARDAFERALRRTLETLGPSRPLQVLLDHLARLALPPETKEERL